jgi:hypothetical protein
MGVLLALDVFIGYRVISLLPPLLANRRSHHRQATRWVSACCGVALFPFTHLFLLATFLLTASMVSL